MEDVDCRTFRQQWTHWREGWLATDAATMAAHRGACRDCARYDRQMRRLVDALATLPPPDAPSEAPVDAGRRSDRRKSRVSIAAALVVGMALGATLMTRFGGPDSEPAVARRAAPVTDAAREIAVAFTSPRALSGVEFVVELPPGIELAGFPGQRTVRWTGRLAEGRSRLRLPLEVGPEATNGDVVTRIQSNGAERMLIVPLDLNAESDAVSSSTSRT